MSEILVPAGWSQTISIKAVNLPTPTVRLRLRKFHLIFQQHRIRYLTLSHFVNSAIRAMIIDYRELVMVVVY